MIIVYSIKKICKYLCTKYMVWSFNAHFEKNIIAWKILGCVVEICSVPFQRTSISKLGSSCT